MNSLHFRAPGIANIKARLAGNTGCIANKRNAEIGDAGRSLRARRRRFVAALRPLARGPTLAGGPRLATKRLRHAEMQRIHDSGH